jgi:hypothetical protein
MILMMILMMKDDVMQSSGILSAIAETFKNPPGHFRPSPKPSKIVRDAFGHRRNLQKPFGTLSAIAETFKNCSGHFRPSPKPSKTVQNTFRTRRFHNS